MIYPIRYRGSDNQGTVLAIIGMQFGSEGKGSIAAHLAGSVEMGVRTGAANAGHTIYYRGQKYVMRQIPTTWVKPSAELVIGAGAIISLDVLLEEIEMLRRFGVARRLSIDWRAHVITPEQIADEQKSDLAQRIGSTSAISREGIGAAAADKVLRKASCVQARDCTALRPYVTDTVDLINSRLEGGDYRVLLEGTQGSGLSLDHGHFPYVTSRDTNASALCASVGIVPYSFATEIIGVTRTYPIRVAGNSGPFGDDAEELSWEEVARRAGTSEDITEKTSVTQKVRRVATFSKKEFLKACRLNRPTCIALTFADYLDWSVHNRIHLSQVVKNFVSEIEELGQVPISFVTTGPQSIVDFELIRYKKFWQWANQRAKAI